MRAEEVIYEKCSVCGNNVKPEHGFRIDGDRVSHIDCAHPIAVAEGKGIQFVSSKGDGTRSPGRKDAS
jgi:ribosomal protein L24E